MNQQELYDFLKRQNIWHEITVHADIYNMSELSTIDAPYPDCVAKNLFVRDNKKREYYLIAVKGDKRVDLKEFRDKYNTRTLSFASAEDLMERMALFPGAVTPFGLLNDEDCKITLFLDRDFMQNPGLIGVHPNHNTATVWLKVNDLVDIIMRHGNPVHIVEV